MKGFCPEHKPKCDTMDYIQHHQWMQKQIKKGIQQTRCPKCKRWLFPCEKGGDAE